MRRALGAKLITPTPRRVEPSYAIGERIGKGAFAQVYKALDVNTAQFVAIKEIPLSEISSVDSIMREIELLQDLAHPNIVQYLGYVKTENVFHIVLEYCENGSLAVILKKFGVFPDNLLSIYMQQVLEGLAYLHEQGTIHRDIKGANILTTKDGVAKLADFGVATDTKQSGNPEGAQAVGTPHWMAPEVIKLEEPTTACDIWSLGCTIIELSTGHPPYSDLPAMAAIYAMVTDDMPPLPVDSSPLARDFMELCFQKDPNLRTSAVLLLDHPWIRRANAPPLVPDAVKTIQQWNSPLRRQKMSVASRLDLRDAYKETALPVPPKEQGNQLRKPISVSKFIEDDDDADFDDIADELELAAPNFHVSPTKARSPQKSPTKAPPDPFEGVAELMVEEPNLQLMNAYKEVEGILSWISKPNTPTGIYFERLCELVVAHPSIKKLLLQNRSIRSSIQLALNISDQSFVEPILDYLYLMITDDANALESFCLNNGLTLILNRFSLEPLKCLQILLLVLSNYSAGPALVVSQGTFVSVLSGFIISAEKQSAALAARCVATIFDKFGGRKRSEIWYIFNSANLLMNVIEALDKPNAAEDLYTLIGSFSRLPTEMVGKFVKKHYLRKLMHVYYRQLEAASPRRLDILRVYKSISSVPEVLDGIERGNLGRFFVRMLADCYKSREPSPHLKAACLLHLFHNYCRISSARQASLAQHGLVPLLIQTSTREPDLKEFSVPLICAMAHTSPECWHALWKCNGLEFLINLVNEDGWEPQAVSALTAWMTRQTDNPDLWKEFGRKGGPAAFVQVVTETHGEIFAAVITSLHSLFEQAPQICKSIPAEGFFTGLRLQMEESLVSMALVNMLKVIRSLLETQHCIPQFLRSGLYKQIEPLKDQRGVPIIPRRLAAEIIERVGDEHLSAA